MHWHLSHRGDPAAVALADRHYNRQKIGSPQFVPPGRCMVLLATQPRKTRRALWVSSWPMQEYTHHAWAGAWVNTLFKNETFWPSSLLICEAVAATRWYTQHIWCQREPELGMITFVDATKVKPVGEKKARIGQCYLDAGFHLVGQTKVNKLLALQLLLGAMPAPAMPIGASYSMFDEAS